jgi:tetratricopeptide (TPR) repeat protein
MPKMIVRFGSRIASLVLVLALAACAGAPVDEPAPKTQATSGVPTPELAQRHTDAVALLEAGRYDEAAVALREIVAAAPALVVPRINLALAYARAGKLEDAQSVLEETVVLAPQSAVAQTQLGIVYRLRGRFPDAERAYLAALAADPARANAHYDLGVLYDLYLQRPTDALAHYQQYQSLAGDDEQVQKWIADLGRRSGAVSTVDSTETAEVVEQ